MAGLSLYFEDNHDDVDDFGYDEYGADCDGIRIITFLDAGHDNLTPLGRLEKYAFSENVFNRQIVARGLLDVLREFSDNENDFVSVMETVARMSEDAEPTVRAELMEQVPNIAMFLHESRPSFPAAFSRYLVPIVVRYLTDPNNQVRKTSQAALLVLLEQSLICKEDMENRVCPVLLDLTEQGSDDDYKIEAVAIMCKVVTMLSRDTVEQQLLPRFCDLCSDGRLFQVRKVCAANFGEFCAIVGQDATERLLMPKFFDLCSDSLWGIRKACAECFMMVSNSTSPEVRRSKLSPLFISLISDQSRWVRQAAFQSLGRFISTFANPSSAGLHFREDGALPEVPRCTADSSSCCPDVRLGYTPANQDGRATPSPEREPLSVHPTAAGNRDKFAFTGGVEPTDENFNSFHYWRPPLPDISGELEMLSCSPAGGAEEQKERGGEDKEEREDMEEGEEQSGENCPDNTPSHGKATSDQIQKVLDCLQPHMDDPDVQAQVQVLSAALKAAQLDSPTHSGSAEPESSGDAEEEMQEEPDHEPQPDPEPEADPESEPEPGPESEPAAETPADAGTSSELEPEETQVFLTDAEDEPSPAESPVRESESAEPEDEDEGSSSSEDRPKVQDVIPQPLLDQYLSMTDPARAQTVDTEIAKHCAFSLPGVALTLGRQNWHCLKDTYETLASDVQWKVRRTLAFSIHELAVILGDQLTAADLVPIFNGFLKDLDEVRIGVLKHLYDFLKLLHADKRREYLYQLQEFMVTDNSRNWRFRYELAEQLILIIELYNHRDVYDYLRHIALTLCSDKVAEVRWISYKLVVEILQKLYSSGADDLGLEFVQELTLRFCHSPKWVGRQAFAFICQAVVEDDCLPPDTFRLHLLPALLGLALDPVANVRVLVAKALRRSVMEKAFFRDPDCPASAQLEETLATLRADKDRDVRFFASADPSRELTDTAPLI